MASSVAASAVPNERAARGARRYAENVNLDPTGLSRYLDLAGDAAGFIARIADLFKTDPASRARRLRRQAARLEGRSRRVASRADAAGPRADRLAERSADLHRRALIAWAEAQALQPISAELAATSDTAPGRA